MSQRCDLIGLESVIASQFPRRGRAAVTFDQQMIELLRSDGDCRQWLRWCLVATEDYRRRSRSGVSGDARSADTTQIRIVCRRESAAVEHKVFDSFNLHLTVRRRENSLRLLGISCSCPFYPLITRPSRAVERSGCRQGNAFGAVRVSL